MESLSYNEGVTAVTDDAKDMKIWEQPREDVAAWKCETCGWTNVGYVVRCDGCQKPLGYNEGVTAVIDDAKDMQTERDNDSAALSPERVDVIELVDGETGFATVRITRETTVQGRMFYRVSTDRDTFNFYVTPKGFLRGGKT